MRNAQRYLSSDAPYCNDTERQKRFGCKDKIVAFMLPLGNSFNLDDSMMYAAQDFAQSRVAQTTQVVRWYRAVMRTELRSRDGCNCQPMGLRGSFATEVK